MSKILKIFPFFVINLLFNILTKIQKKKTKRNNNLTTKGYISATKFLEENHCRNLYPLKGCLPRQLKFEWKSMHFFFNLNFFNKRIYCKIETCECSFFFSCGVLPCLFFSCGVLHCQQLSSKALRKKNVTRFLEAKVKPNKPTN